jgi:hypothetical protein
MGVVGWYSGGVIDLSTFIKLTNLEELLAQNPET